MTRYLVLEVVDDVHDLTDLVETMAENGVNRRALLAAGGYNLDVRIPPRPLVQEFALAGPGHVKLYVEEAR